MDTAYDNRWESSRSIDIDETKAAPMAIIYRSEIDYISQCILDYQNIETGGQLFGFLTEYGVPVVCYAIGPGDYANHQATFFNQDTDYLQAVYHELNSRYQLQYIGEWHSHHQLGLAHPSGHDAQTIIRGIKHQKLRHFLLCIGNCSKGSSTLNAFTFHLDSPENYKHVPWKVCEMTSPYRPIIDRELKQLLRHPYSCPRHGNLYTISNVSTQHMTVPDYREGYWLNTKSNNLVLKKIIDYLAIFDSGEDQVKAMLDHDRHVRLQINRKTTNEIISFDADFPYSAPRIIITPDAVMRDIPDWSYCDASDDIFGCFTDYYNLFIDAYFKSASSQKNSELAFEKQESMADDSQLEGNQ